MFRVAFFQLQNAALNYKSLMSKQLNARINISEDLELPELHLIMGLILIQIDLW